MAWAEAKGRMRGKRYTSAELEAYWDGRKAANSGRPAYERPNYPTHEERDAFKLGFDQETELLLMGYAPLHSAFEMADG